MAQIYCGNNGADTDLLVGRSVLGTKYKCMRKGVGKGLNLPYDPKFNGVYMPIDERIIYCGDKADLPSGYDRFGNLPSCLQKGVGIGKRLKAQKSLPNYQFGNSTYDPQKKPVIKKLFNTQEKYQFGYSTRGFMYIWPIVIFIILSAAIFFIIYFIRPSFITKKVGNKTKIDWGKFMAYFIANMVIIGLTIFLTWKFYIFRT